MKKIKIKNLKRRISAFVLAGTITTTMTSCATELSSANTNYDTINTNEDMENSNGLTKGIKQILEVNGEEFKLIIDYVCDDSAWCITSDKSLYMSVYTEGLSSDKNVYIDDIHIDTSILATNAYFDGILQDTLDDGVHSALILGFPISDTNKYFGVNVIEGQNSEFIEGFTHAYNGYYSAEYLNKRRLESDFLEKGVYANKITGVIGLVIEDKNTGKILRGVDVPTTLIVEVNNKITFKEKDKYVTYQYDKYGNREIVDEKPKTKELVKTK